MKSNSSRDPDPDDLSSGPQDPKSGDPEGRKGYVPRGPESSSAAGESGKKKLLDSQLWCNEG